jgi:hypothetical protein
MISYNYGIDFYNEDFTSISESMDGNSGFGID